MRQVPKFLRYKGDIWFSPGVKACMCYTCYFRLQKLWYWARYIKHELYSQHKCRFLGYHDYYAGHYDKRLSWKTWCRNCGKV